MMENPSELAPEPMQNLYDEEIFRIRELLSQVNYKFSETSPTPEHLKEFQKYVQGVFFDAGFYAEVNMVDYLTALLLGQDELPPPEIVIMGRVDALEEFDHEKKGWEVERHGKITEL